jgi:hypothetical protein
MTTDAPKPPPFYCPACGRRHRAEAGWGGAGSAAPVRVTCQRCGAAMAFALGADGLPTCELLAAPADAGRVATASRGPVTPTGGAMPRSPLALPLSLAALVAAVVAFVVAQLAPARGAPAPEDPRVAALEQRLAETEARLHEAIARAEAAGRKAVEPLVQELGERVASLSSGLGAQAQTLAGIEQLHRQAGEGALELREQVRAMSGRVEANYQRGRELTKRVEALEAR